MSGFYSVNSEEVMERDTTEFVTFRDYEGLLGRTFIPNLRSKNSGDWETYVTYFYTSPELGDMQEGYKGKPYYPPLTNPLLNRKVYCQDVQAVQGDDDRIPSPLRRLPMHHLRKYDDRSILNSVVPGRYGQYEDSGKPKPGNEQWFIFGLAKPGTGEMSPNIFTMSNSLYERLVRKLESHAKKGAQIVGTPWRVEKNGDILEVTPYDGEPAQEMDLAELTLPGSEVSILENHIDKLREYYEDYIIERGWQYDEYENEDGFVLRRNWHNDNVAEASMFEQVTGMKPPFTPDGNVSAPPDFAMPTTAAKAETSFDDYAELKNDELRKLVEGKGIEVPKSMKRKDLLALLSI